MVLETIFENGGRTDDGRRTVAILKVTNEPKGSGELKIKISKKLDVITVKSEQSDFIIRAPSSKF